MTLWLVNLLLCIAQIGFLVWLLRDNRRVARRRAALDEQIQIVKSLWIARANGDRDNALALVGRFHEHDEALTAEFPELKGK